jgi:hypothetical protein
MAAGEGTIKARSADNVMRASTPLAGQTLSSTL